MLPLFILSSQFAVDTLPISWKCLESTSVRDPGLSSFSTQASSTFCCFAVLCPDELLTLPALLPGLLFSAPPLSKDLALSMMFFDLLADLLILLQTPSLLDFCCCCICCCCMYCCCICCCCIIIIFDSVVCFISVWWVSCLIV